MISLKLLICSFLLFICVNGKTNSFTLTLQKRTPYTSVDQFRKNVEYYRNLLPLVFRPKSSEISGKTDKNVDYYAEIGLGNHIAIKLRVTLDTSFSGLWVVGPVCQNYWICADKRHYKTGHSDTHVPDELEGVLQFRTIVYEKKYGRDEADVLAGSLGFDTLWMQYGQIEVPGVHFLIATNVPSEFTDLKTDGVFGLGFPSGSLKMAPPFFTMLDRGMLDSCEISLFVGRRDQVGEMVLGGRNDSYYVKDSLYFHKLRSQDNWTVTIDSIVFHGESLCASFCEGLIDTGTALIAAPIASLHSMYKALDLEYTGNITEVSCDDRQKMPMLKLSIDDQVFVLNGEGYTIQVENSCVLAVMESPKDDLWILGNVFLSTVYTIFNVAEMKIGFAYLNV